ncbi:MAG: hypothetical protein LN560_00720 [Rickettsia endosymbiont of Sceptobius lativentris]|nr:hypothetical protein [Rickettsia endosymbiont of Sceptobius lativentris]
MSSYEITVKWVTSSHDTGWYFPLEVTIKNNTNQAVFAPEISFDLSKVQHIDTNQPINAYTGFTHHSNTFPVIKGNLAEHI